MRNAAGTNWAGNHTYGAAELRSPESVKEVQELVNAGKRVKALGRRHSFNAVADTEGTLLSLERFQTMELDASARTARVGAGVSYGELAPWLEGQGFAVPNLASLPHISVAGACATGTHGSGIANGCLSTAVVGLDLVDGTGKVVWLRRGDADFAGAVVGLGALGIVTAVTLKVVPRFEVTQAVYEDLPFEALAPDALAPDSKGDGMRAVFSAGYSVSLFTDWQENRATQVWVKRLAAKPVLPELFGAKMQTEPLHPIAGHSAEFCTEQMGVPGTSFERLPHFRMEFTPSSGQELQSEYFVGLADGYAALRAVEELRKEIAPLLLVSELRTVAADELWLSMAYRRESLALHFTWRPEWAAVKPLLKKIEAKLAPFAPRPHWGKMSCMSGAKVRGAYPRMAEFAELRRRFDPEGKFGNGFLGDTLG